MSVKVRTCSTHTYSGSCSGVGDLWLLRRWAFNAPEEVRHFLDTMLLVDPEQGCSGYSNGKGSRPVTHSLETCVPSNVFCASSTDLPETAMFARTMEWSIPGRIHGTTCNQHNPVCKDTSTCREFLQQEGYIG